MISDLYRLNYYLYRLKYIIYNYETQIVAPKTLERLFLSLGYDIRSESGYEAMKKEFLSVIGQKYLKAVHLNDSKGLHELGQVRPEIKSTV